MNTFSKAALGLGACAAACAATLVLPALVGAGGLGLGLGVGAMSAELGIIAAVASLGLGYLLWRRRGHARLAQPAAHGAACAADGSCGCGPGNGTHDQAEHRAG